MPKLMQQRTSQVKQLQTCFTMTLSYPLGFHQRSTMTRVVHLKMNSSIFSRNYLMSSTHKQCPTTHKVTGKPKDSTESINASHLTRSNKSHWRDHLPKLVHVYNCTRHEATGFSPFALLFGRSHHLPIDLLFGIGMKQPSKNYPSYLTQWSNAIQEAY